MYKEQDGIESQPGTNSSEDIATALQDIQIAIEDSKNAQNSDQNPVQKFLRPILEVGTYLTGLTVFVTLVTYLLGEEARHQTQIDAAWNTVLASVNQPGDGGRRNALEFLNSNHRRFPWFWRKWERQSLDGLIAKEAVLRGLQLPEALLYKAQLSNAEFIDSNLSDAELVAADLSGTVLFMTNLANSNLSHADLSSSIIILESGYEPERQGCVEYEKLVGNQNVRLQDCKDHAIGINLYNTNLSDTFILNANFLDARFSAADLSNAILLAMDLRHANGLTIEQLKGENQPFLCNVALPDHLSEKVDPYRDCDNPILPQVFFDRTQPQTATLDTARYIVNEARKKTWD